MGAFARDLRYAADSDFKQRFAKLQLPHAWSPILFYRDRRRAGSATQRDKEAGEAVCADMLRLAAKWRDDGDAKVRDAALALEGRCRAVLALDALRRGDNLLHAPAIVRGVADYAAPRVIPRLRRRRLGAPPRLGKSGNATLRFTP